MGKTLKFGTAEAEPVPQDVTLEQAHEDLVVAKFVDSYGQLVRAVEEIMKSPEFEQLRSKKAQLLALIPDEADPEEKFELEGKVFTVEISKAKKTRKIIDLVKVFEALGEDLFVKLASIPMSGIDLHLSEAEQAECIETNFSKTRTIKLTKK